MILEIEDEKHGDQWSGYLTVRAYDDDETLLLEGHVASEVAEDLGDAYLETVTNLDVLRTLSELLEDNRPDPGGPVL